MKKNIFGAIMAIGFFITAGIGFIPTKAEAQGNGLKWVQTNCVVKRTGEIVGHSNNCNPGGTNCNDNDCSHVGGPITTLAGIE